ncbi:amino acid adenylation domain-containing protein [Streptomyces lydicus]|uniref:amino acid adenylation domain-containing protein n=1 Tax=Streptomyces lydicus TaxID=47763 RepID=UPI002870A7D9|nr:amino acid adenylation domain-containing protein [Streptomyces lydicus]
MTRSPLLHDLVTRAARRTPGAPAVADPATTLTYAQLDVTADQLAAELHHIGVAAGDRVAIWTDKTVRAVAATQAVLRLGAVYVPIDPLNPAHRAAQIIEDCTPAAVITTADRAPAVTRPGTALLLDRPAAPHRTPAATPSRCAPRPRPSPDSPAYILYTSGSTGRPKGVCLSHRNALAFVDWAVDTLHAAPSDRFANHAPLNFDLSVLDLYTAFAAGASVHLIPADLAYAPRALTELLDHRQLTVWYSVPSALQLMMRAGGLLDRPLPHLRAVLFAGEVFPSDDLHRLRRHWSGKRFLNLYGPTETNVCAAYELPPPDATPPPLPTPIGRPTCGNDVRILAPDDELAVAGPTVMLGYWNRPPHQGWYRTGDRVRLAENGDLIYLGRLDDTVKIHGIRMHLTEIEAALASHPHVSEAAALVTRSALDTRLTAFIVPATTTPPTLLTLKRHCATRLPRGITIDAVHHLPALPRNANGKIDRHQLRRDSDPGSDAP